MSQKWARVLKARGLCADATVRPVMSHQSVRETVYREAFKMDWNRAVVNVQLYGQHTRRPLKQSYDPLLVLSARDEIAARQVLWMATVAIATGYCREDPFRIEGIGRMSGFYFNLGVSLRREKSS
ncbi:hypothetical protein AVEN_52035-1 [Araneus ventricosus]|uniref:Uncharacterized protein n=1 Tax=Araneus ventricosus TaxID=182803 RepID=A0A4Y2CGC5_ARAVE|nr:hypothetical protein AVEN_52035-1 [Araneus ventricosus]